MSRLDVPWLIQRSDWLPPIFCGNVNAVTGKCGGAGKS